MRQALGRGLEALISGAEDKSLGSEGGKQSVQKIPITSIRPNHLQPRKNFDPEKLSGLAQSIKENGLAQPIIVSKDPMGGTFELIAGERRLRASQLAGLTHIEAVVKEPMPDRQRLAIAIVENLQREDLNPIEQALGYLRLMKEFAINQTQLSDIVGKSKPAISNTLRLLDLPEPIQKALEFNEISEGHARALLGIQNKSFILEAFYKVVSQKMSVREVEDFIREMQDGQEDAAIKKGAAPKIKSADISSMESVLQKNLGTKVEIITKKSSTKGVVRIHFYDLTDFDRILKMLIK
jgi:ParB family chromosome partitioning protein